MNSNDVFLQNNFTVASEKFQLLQYLVSPGVKEGEMGSKTRKIAARNNAAPSYGRRTYARVLG